MAKVNFGELGSVNFPEEWSEDQLRSHLEENGAAIRNELLARAQAVNAQEAQDEAGPDTVLETIGSMAGSVVQGGSTAIAGAARTANRTINAASGWYEPDLVETPAGRQALATEETPAETAVRVNSGPGIEVGNAIEQGAAKAVPTLPDSAAGFWTGDVPQGFGSAGAMVGPGLIFGPAAGLAIGFGAEADDAFSEEIRRQQEKGETPNMDKAMAKSLGYGSVATAIESGLGAGRIIRKLKSKFGGNTVEETVNAAVRQGVSGTFIGRLLKGGLKDAGAGFTEEALQRMSEDLIVHGSVNVEGMMREGAAGSVVQAVLGIPANAKARRQVTAQTARDAASAGLGQTGSIVADMSNAAEVMTPDLTEADVSDLYADPAAVGTQSETDRVMQAAEDARRAAQAAQTLPTEPVATEGTGEDPAAVGAVEPIAEPSTQPPNANSSTLSNDAANWDRANRSRRSDEWFEGAMVNSAARAGFDESLKEGGNNLAAHGMAKERTLTGAIQNLENLLRNGLDPSRNRGELHYAPLALATGSAHAGTTAGGTAYRDGPFILVARPGMEFSGKLEGVGAILVNEAHTEITDGLRALVQSIRPDIIVGNFSDAGRITRSLLASKSTAQNTQSNEPAPAESEGSTEPGVRQGDTGNLVPGVPAGSDNGGDAVPADRDQSSSTTGAVMDGGSSVPGSDAAVVGTVPGTGVSTTSELAPSVRDQTTGRGIVPESGAAEGNQRTDPVRPGVQTGNGPAQRAEESEPVLPGKIRQAVPAGVAPAEVTANSSKDIASGMQAMGQAAGSNLRDQLWDAHQKGKTKVAGIRERMLVVADAKGVSKTDRAAFDAFIDEYTKKEDAEREAKRPKNLGKNRRGFDVFEDENGVRSYVDGGVRVTEDVQIIPTRGGNRISVDVTKRGSDYLTEGEWRDKQGKSPSSSPKPVTTQGTPPASDPKDAKLAEIQARREDAKKRLRDKLGGVSSGIDPEIAVIAAELAVTYVEEGVVRFPDFAKRVKEEMGDIWDSLKTYLHGDRKSVV